MTLNVDTILDSHTCGLDVDHREIYLHSYIANVDEDPGIDYRMASHFAKNIRILDLIVNLLLFTCTVSEVIGMMGWLSMTLLKFVNPM